MNWANVLLIRVTFLFHDTCTEVIQTTTTEAVAVAEMTMPEDVAVDDAGDPTPPADQQSAQPPDAANLLASAIQQAACNRTPDDRIKKSQIDASRSYR